MINVAGYFAPVSKSRDGANEYQNLEGFHNRERFWTSNMEIDLVKKSKKTQKNKNPKIQK